MRTFDAGEVLESVRIPNDVDSMDRVLARAGVDPEVVLGATYGCIGRSTPFRGRCAGASGAPAGRAVLRVSAGQDEERRQGSRGCGWAGCPRRGSRDRRPGSCGSRSGTGTCPSTVTPRAGSQSSLSHLLPTFSPGHRPSRSKSTSPPDAGNPNDSASASSPMPDASSARDAEVDYDSHATGHGTTSSTPAGTHSAPPEHPIPTPRLGPGEPATLSDGGRPRPRNQPPARSPPTRIRAVG